MNEKLTISHSNGRLNPEFAPKTQMKPTTPVITSTPTQIVSKPIEENKTMTNNNKTTSALDELAKARSANVQNETTSVKQIPGREMVITTTPDMNTGSNKRSRTETGSDSISSNIAMHVIIPLTFREHLWGKLILTKKTPI